MKTVNVRPNCTGRGLYNSEQTKGMHIVKKLVATMFLALTILTQTPVGTAHATEEIVGQGKVNTIYEDRINLSHDAIEVLGWPAMTMDFGLASDVDVSNVSTGQTVKFYLEKDTSGMFEIIRLDTEQ